MIPDGASLMVGGFMGVGTPERIIDEIVRQSKRDLTVIANDTAMPGRGVGKLVDAKLLRGPSDDSRCESEAARRQERSDRRHRQRAVDRLGLRQGVPGVRR